MENNIPENENITPANESTSEAVEETLDFEITAEELAAVEDTFQESAAPQEVPAKQETFDPQRQPEQEPVADATSGANEPYVAHPAASKPQKPCKAGVSLGSTFWKRLVCAVLVVLLVAGACWGTAYSVNNYWEGRYQSLRQEMYNKLDGNNNAPSFGNSDNNDSDGTPVQSVSGTMTPAQVYAKNADTVVMVWCQVSGQQNGQSVTGTSTGSGFIITEDGYIVTNAHVVEGATSVRITTTDNMEYPAQIVGTDSVNDVALLKINAVDLNYAKIGSSSDLIVGDQVVAIGNPLGELTSTLTVGYISAKERNVNSSGNTINMLQTDAAINSGNSGGPLFNMKGEVVGITTAKYSGTTESGAVIEGIGFAIPIDDVYELLSDLMNYGYVTGAYLGVSVSDMDPEAASYYGMPVGAYVHEAVPGYCAAKAGLQAKDIIVALGDYEVGTVSELTRVLRKFKPGDETTITIYRGGREMVLSITLDEKPQTTTTTPDFPDDMPEGNFEEWYNYFAPYFGIG